MLRLLWLGTCGCGSGHGLCLLLQLLMLVLFFVVNCEKCGDVLFECVLVSFQLSLLLLLLCGGVVILGWLLGTCVVWGAL